MRSKLLEGKLTSILSLLSSSPYLKVINRGCNFIKFFTITDCNLESDTIVVTCGCSRSSFKLCTVLNKKKRSRQKKGRKKKKENMKVAGCKLVFSFIFMMCISEKINGMTVFSNDNCTCITMEDATMVRLRFADFSDQVEAYIMSFYRDMWVPSKFFLDKQQQNLFLYFRVIFAPKIYRGLICWKFLSVAQKSRDTERSRRFSGSWKHFRRKRGKDNATRDKARRAGTAPMEEGDQGETGETTRETTARETKEDK